MGKPTITALRVVLALLLAGGLVVQGVIVPLLTVDMSHADGDIRDARFLVAAILVLYVLGMQVAIVAVWQLLTMVRRDTVFSAAAFRWVHVVIGGFVAAAALWFTLACTLAPGDSAAPGVVLLICGVSLGHGGIALLVLVMRALLAQAVTQRSELDEVI